MAFFHRLRELLPVTSYPSQSIRIGLACRNVLMDFSLSLLLGDIFVGSLRLFCTLESIPIWSASGISTNSTPVFSFIHRWKAIRQLVEVLLGR
ncbi:hypothetical protein MLD38_007726 [Melastoma candidum]|uniref:Uncharacterized protein n=1 Tax=Melastoma candidum TaxID=119954 RepID=A0ACB9RTX7_9MYRT|nr:hypothetical protein MLD38_007726 [Melastoma candidum]